VQRATPSRVCLARPAVGAGVVAAVSRMVFLTWVSRTQSAIGKPSAVEKMGLTFGHKGLLHLAEVEHI
jgi:hypothetical protein